MGENVFPSSAAAVDSQEATEHSPLLKQPDNTVTITSFGRRSTYSSESSQSFSSSSDEESLAGPTPVEDAPGQLSHSRVAQIIMVLLIAVFVFNADGSLVLATHPVIASEFDALESSSWLFIGFGLAGAATQTTFGKLSDIYGRKPIILFCYATFAIGCVIVGLGQSMLAVILGRVISGGVGAGMTVLVSILITDLIPIREVATWRAYVNVAATTGRSLGGPLGGWLADVVGWRWSFLGQAPLLLIAIILCWTYLPNTVPQHHKNDPENESKLAKLKRVDFTGSILLALLILSFLLPLEIGGVKIPWSHPLIPSLFGAATLFLILFVICESRWSKDPILPLSLFAKWDTVASFLIMALQVSAQIGLMFSVPIYFQVTQKVSNTEAGAHLFPAVAGNAIGGIMSGVLIMKTGKYKWLIYFATISSSVCYFLLLLRWHGNTNWWESLYIIPGGFGTGIAQSAVFISIQAAVEAAHIAPAVSTLYLSTGVGAIAGLACMSAATQGVLRGHLQARLLELGLDEAERLEIVTRAVSSVDYIYQAKGKVAEAIVASYVDGLWWSHALSLGCSLLALVISLPLSEYKV